MIKKQGRWRGLDIVKAIGVILMVVLHVVMWWYIPYDYGAERVSEMFFFFLPFLKFIGLFVIIIPITAGASLRYFLDENFKDNEKLVMVLKRSFLLIFTGYFMNLLAWGRAEFLDWDVLQFVGVGLALAALMIRFFSMPFLWIVGALTLISAPFLRMALGKWELNYIIAVLIGNNEGNFFWPFFQWFSFIIYGFFISHYRLTCRNKKNIYLILQIFSFIVLILAFYLNKLFFVDDIRNIWGPGIFQAPTLTLLANIGVFNLMLIFAEKFFKSVKTKKFGVINVFGRGILWIYVLHIVIGYYLVNFVKYYFVDSVMAMLITIAFMLVLSYVIGVAAVWLKERKAMLTTN